MSKLLITLSFILIGCSSLTNSKTIKVYLDPKKSGWYFIEVLRDSTSNSETTKITFSDSLKFISVKSNIKDGITLSPYDLKGNSLSSRLKLFNRMELPDKEYLSFYNPTEEELANIYKWSAGNDRAFAIQRNGDDELEKFLKNP